MLLVLVLGEDVVIGPTLLLCADTVGGAFVFITCISLSNGIGIFKKLASKISGTCLWHDSQRSYLEKPIKSNFSYLTPTIGSVLQLSH